MRSSKSRSRSKGNRNRSVGNVVNRVFDSSGPEGKVRGTPQQIIDKYNQLARDAQLSNDRVAAENFQQHAEHYTRMLADALREQQERQERQQQQNQQNNAQNPKNAQANRDDDGAAQDVNQKQQSPENKPQEPNGNKGGDVIDIEGDAAESSLVETPEERPQRQRRPRRKPRAAEQDEQPQPVAAPQPPQDAAE